MTKLPHGPTIQLVGRLGFDQFPLWRWGTVQPSSSMKHSFSPARSSVTKGTCPRTHTSRSWSVRRGRGRPGYSDFAFNHGGRARASRWRKVFHGEIM